MFDTYSLGLGDGNRCSSVDRIDLATLHRRYFHRATWRGKKRGIVMSSFYSQSFVSSRGGLQITRSKTRRKLVSQLDDTQETMRTVLEATKWTRN